MILQIKLNIMNTKKTILFFAFLGLWISTVNAQSDTEWRSGKQVNDNYDHNWSFGAGFNIVEDSGTKGGLANPADRWNISQPLALNAEYYLNNYISFNAMFTMNKYKEGKIVDHAYIIEGHEASYMAFDLAAKLYFRDWIKTYKFDPYIFAGFGFTNIGEYQAIKVDEYAPDYGVFEVPSIGRMTVNTGLGFNVWFSQTWGLNLNIAGKWGIATSEHEIGPNSISSQFQTALGVIYFLN